MVSRRALAPVAASGEATKPGLAPNGSLNQLSPIGRIIPQNPSLMLRVWEQTLDGA